MLSELDEGSPVIAAIKAKIQQPLNPMNSNKIDDISKLDSDIPHGNLVNSESDSESEPWV